MSKEGKIPGNQFHVYTQQDVAALMGLSTTSIKTIRKNDPSFPPRRSFGGVKGWLFRDLVNWLESAPVVDESVAGD